MTTSKVGAESKTTDETAKKRTKTKTTEGTGKRADEIIIEKLLAKIEENNELPWMKPWFVPCMNWYTKREYRGINLFLLQDGSGEYLTFNQLKEYNEKNGTDYRINKNAAGYTPNYVLISDRKTRKISAESAQKAIAEGNGAYVFQDDTGQWYRRTSVYKYFIVYDIKHIMNKDGETLPSRLTTGITIRYKNADEIITNYKDRVGVKITEKTADRAYYTQLTDTVVLPPQKYFKEPTSYYRVLFHELIHSTGIKERLNRQCFEDYHRDRKIRSQEELVAELGAMYLLGLSGIREDNKQDLWDYNSESYIVGWAQYIRDNKKAVLQAFSMAEKAKSYIMGNDKPEDDVTDVPIK